MDKQNRSVIELVFVLDTTGSMGGLIEGAKQRIWGIVNDLMKEKAKPSVRIGLVAYRDRGDQYVTKVQTISSDLDKVYGILMDYQANGGGDGPEDVQSALWEGVRNVGWAQRGPNLAQVLFLVGDAPPHADYKDHPDVLTTASDAIRRGIIVNAIQCGNVPGTAEVWQKVARAAEGEYFAIQQDGGVQVVATPYDSKLAALGGKVGSTYLAYGSATYQMAAGGAAARTEARFAAAAPVAAQADRALNKALNRSAFNEGDLLQQVENGAVKLESLKESELPAELKKLPAAARKKEIDRRIAERSAIKAEILTLSKQRDAYLADQRKKLASKSPGAKGFDTAVAAALKKQVAKRGIKL